MCESVCVCFALVLTNYRLSLLASRPRPRRRNSLGVSVFSQQAHAQHLLRQLPLARGSGSPENVLRGLRIMEYGHLVFLDPLRRALRVPVGGDQAVGPVLRNYRYSCLGVLNPRTSRRVPSPPLGVS